MRILGTARSQLQIFLRRRRNHDREFALLRLRRVREKVHTVLGVAPILPHFYDEPIRIRFEAHGESGVGLGLENDTRHARNRLRHANPADKRVAHIDYFADQVGSELRVAQVEIDAVWAREAMRLICTWSSRSRTTVLESADAQWRMAVTRGNFDSSCVLAGELAVSSESDIASGVAFASVAEFALAAGAEGTGACGTPAEAVVF